MISWAGFSALSPMLLGVIPFGFGLLVYVYRRRGSGKRLVVASLMLLRTLERAPQAKQRFFPPPRFFLELLLVLLLSAAAAGIHPSSDLGPLAVVVDTSFSMGAVIPGNSSGQTYLGAALDRVRGELDNQPGSRSISLYETGKSGPVVVGSSSDVIAKLTELQPRYQSDSLEGTISYLLGDATISEIVAFSDRPEYTAKIIERNKVRYQGLQSGGQKKLNIGNAALSDISQKATTNGVAITVTARNFGTEGIPVSLVLLGISENVAPTRLAEQRMELSPTNPVNITFDIPTPIHQAFRVSLKPQGSAARLDALRGDNDAWISLQQPEVNVGVVSDLTPAQLGLGVLNRFRFIPVSRTSWEQFDQKSLNLVIFHRWAPQTTPAIPSLSVLPPPQSQPFALYPPNSQSQKSGAQSITRWLESDPLLTYVNIAALDFSKSLNLSETPWARAIITTTGGPVMLAGEQGAARHLGFGFEIFPFEGAKSVGLGIVLLNSLRWLSDVRFQYETVGAAVSPGVRAIDPVDAIVSPPNATSPGLIGESAGLRAINFFSDAESDLNNPAAFERPVVTGTEVVESDAALRAATWGRSLAGIALVLLLLDLLFFSARQSIFTKRK